MVPALHSAVFVVLLPGDIADMECVSIVTASVDSYCMFCMVHVAGSEGQ